MKDNKKADDVVHSFSATTWAVAIVLIPVGILVAAVGFFVYHQKPGGILQNLTDYGTFLQGTVGVLWSLAGFFIISGAFILQWRQMKQQEAQAEEQGKQFQEQLDSVKRQNFETAFFQLLKFSNDLTEGLQHSTRIISSRGSTSRDYYGHQCIQLWWDRFRNALLDKSEDGTVSLQDKEALLEVFSNFYLDYQNELGRYFRTLYHVFKFVRDGDIGPLEKKRYTSLVRAQLSTTGLLLLFYNCLTKAGEGFKPLIEEFSLLEHLDQSLLLHPSHVDWYSQGAYAHSASHPEPSMTSADNRGNG